MSSFDRDVYVQMVKGSCVDELCDDRGSRELWVEKNASVRGISKGIGVRLSGGHRT